MDTRPWLPLLTYPSLRLFTAAEPWKEREDLWFNPGELFLLPLWSLQLVGKRGFSVRAPPGMDPPQEMRTQNTAHPHSSTNTAQTNPAALLPCPPNG